MELKLIDYNTAVLTKEKGFCILTNASYFIHTKKLLKDMCCKNDVNGDDQFVSAPTQYLLQQWLREKHNIHIIIIPEYDEEGSQMLYEFNIIYDNIEDERDYTFYHSYEEALEQALISALNLIKI